MTVSVLDSSGLVLSMTGANFFQRLLRYDSEGLWTQVFRRSSSLDRSRDQCPFAPEENPVG
jgi:hypothetical protein